MISYRTGNLLDAKVEAIVNTVNTVGVMGKGIALMFKEAFPENFRLYELACKKEEVKIGHMFVTENVALEGSRWIINFPSKKHWRQPSKLEWIVEGLQDLRHVIEDKGIRSIALPPIGCGNGGLDWSDVRPKIEDALATLDNVEIEVFEPTPKYQNVAKRFGVVRLTPARALIAEMVRRYSVLGSECTYLEVQKLGWFLERMLAAAQLPNSLDLRFVADKYGPYSDRLRHLLNGLDGTYLHCDKRLSDADPSDAIRFDDSMRIRLDVYLKQNDIVSLKAILEKTAKLIDGFESPLGMELLATVDWLMVKQGCDLSVSAIRDGISHWPGGTEAAARKQKLFSDRLLQLALMQLIDSSAKTN